MFFGDWLRKNARNILGSHKCFQLAPGLKVNLSKSKLFGVGVPFEDVVGNLTIWLGCRLGSYFYLSVFVGVMQICDV